MSKTVKTLAYILIFNNYIVYNIYLCSSIASSRKICRQKISIICNRKNSNIYLLQYLSTVSIYVHTYIVHLKSNNETLAMRHKNRLKLAR